MIPGRRKPPQHQIGLDGALWMTAGGQPLGGRDRVALLQAVADRGSITQAARAVGMSYKAAWDAVDGMNRLAGEPLVERSTGGAGGGSTRLTQRGRALVERFTQLAAAHDKFVRLLGERSSDLQIDFNLLRTINMKTSARNQFVGTVTAVRAGAVNDEVELTLAGGARIVAVLTRESTESLGLRTSMTAFALVKSSSIVLATELADVRLSARNQLSGVVSDIRVGAVNTEVVIDLGGGVSVAAIVTQASARRMDLAVGTRATALFKASSVILGVML